jgi:hypothetical protein
VDFRSRLLQTLRAVRPVLEEPGVLVVGSEVPNLLEPDAASTLVVSQDVDLGVEIGAHAAVKRRLRELERLRPSPEEPSVWISDDPALIEVNFLGIDRSVRDVAETYVLEDAELPLMVFGPLSLVQPGERVVVADLTIPVPRVAGMLLEKLVTDRTGDKGERDLLVVAGLLHAARDADLHELETAYREQLPEIRYAVRSNLTVLSLLEPRHAMPDPRPHRAAIAALLGRLERHEGGPP